MIKLRHRLLCLLRDTTGLTTVEYAIAGGLIGAAMIVTFIILGGHVGDIITYIDGVICGSAPAC